MKRAKLNLKIGYPSGCIELWATDARSVCDLGINLLKQGIIEGENPVFDLESSPRTIRVHRVELFGIAALNGW